MIIHVVKPNETVYTIAQSYSVPPMRIINDNELSEPNNLVVGQTLVILYPNTEHIVRQGDTLFTIAEEYGVTVNQLLRNNPVLIGNTELNVGQVIVIDYHTEKLGTLSVGGYVYDFVNIDTFRRTLPYLTYIYLFTYGIDMDGNISTTIDDEGLIETAREYGVAPLLVLSTLTPEGVFNTEAAHQLLINPENQARLTEQLLTILREKNYYGVDIDFEYIYAEDRELYNQFIANLSNTLNSEGFIVTVALAPKTSPDQPGLLYEGHDYRALGEAANYVLLMTYEWGYAFGPPMAVAPINEVARVLQYGMTEIPQSKIFMGIPNYGYDWKVPYERGVRARSLGNVEAVEQAFDMNAEILYDYTSQAPHYTYFLDSQQHEVWFEDARSIDAKLKLANESGINGVTYWQLMRYFPQNWLVLNTQYDITKVL